MSTRSIESPSNWTRVLAWLTLAALADWLIARTLTRAGIFMPKAPAISTAFQGLGMIGRLAITTSALLAIGFLGWYAWKGFHRGQKLLPASLVVLIGMMMTFLFVAPSGWLMLAYHIVAIIALLAIAVEAWSFDSTWKRRTSWGVPAAALLSGELYLVASALEAALRDPAINGALFFNLGELLFVVSGFVLWWYYGRKHLPWRARLLPALVALMFSGFFLVQPAMTGMISIWSTGLTLYLPWPLYILSLYAAFTAVVVQLRARQPEGLGILLLLAAGLAPQLSYQFMVGLIGLLVISLPLARLESASKSTVQDGLAAEA